MATSLTKCLLLVCLSAVTNLSIAQSGMGNTEIDFISDTQQPLTIEEIKLRPNHNTKATAMLLADVLQHKPLALYMLGDVVAIGSSHHKWRTMDRFIDTCRKINIGVYGLLGNHDILWSRKKGEKNFQIRFPDNVNTGYVSIIDSMAIVMLNANFKKLTAVEIDKQQRWYIATVGKLDSNNAIKTIIVCCHHSPFSNSLVVGSSANVQHYFLPTFLQTAKCRLFISGHAHAFEHFKQSGKDFLVIGGGGGLHQPLDTSAKRIPDVASDYKPMFHYLSLQRKGDTLLLTSHFLKPDFSAVEKGYSFEVDLENKAIRSSETRQ
jgi:hypothetical protein